MYYWRIPDEVWRCPQRLHYPAPRYAVDSVGHVQGDDYSYPFSSDHVLRHRSYPLHRVHGGAASAKSILAIVPSGNPPLHVRLQTGGYHPFEEFAHLVEKTHRPVRRRRVRRSAPLSAAARDSPYATSVGRRLPSGIWRTGAADGEPRCRSTPSRLGMGSHPDPAPRRGMPSSARL